MLLCERDVSVPANPPKSRMLLLIENADERDAPGVYVPRLTQISVPLTASAIVAARDVDALAQLRPDASPVAFASTNRSGAKLAVTEVEELRVTRHEPVPEQAPPQPVKIIPASAVGVSVTILPDVKFALHVVPQSMPDGALPMWPVPSPAVATLRFTQEIAALNSYAPRLFNHGD